MKDIEKSLKYFEYKIKYAKNKKLHAEHLNRLIELYNAHRRLLSQEPATMIRNLTMALYAELLTRYQAPEIAFTKLKQYVLHHRSNAIELEQSAINVALSGYKLNPFKPVNDKDIYEITRRIYMSDDAKQLAYNDINTILQDL